MASSGKKGKTRWKPMATAQIIDTDAPRKLTSGSWADEASNDLDDNYDYGRKSDVKVNLPTAPRAARGAENDANVPKEPPFQAYLSNLSYEVTEDDLAAFFSSMRVKSVRLPRDDRGSSKAKGFGYVEFEDRNSLIEALSMPDTTCKNRRMRIEVAENGEQGRGGRGGQRDRGPSEPDRTMGDWRSGPRQEAEPDRDGYRSGPRRDFGGDRDRGGGGMYDRDRRGGGFRDDDRDRGSFRSRDGDRPGFRDNRGGFRDDRGGGGGGGFRDRDDRGSGFRDGGDRYERRGGYDDRRDDRRDFGGDRGGTWRSQPQQSEQRSDRDRDRDRDMGPPPERTGEPKTRTKLNLQPRTRVEERLGAEEGAAPAPAPSAPAAASIFGGAKPVDTAARERQIEERLLAKERVDRPPPSKSEESRVPASQQPPARDPPSSQDDAPASPPPLEPAPPPKENVWAKRSQQTTPSQVNNGRISPHEDGESHKHRDSSPSNEPRKYQPPRRNAQDDRRRDERGPPRGGGPARGGGPRNVDTRQSAPPKPREHKKESSDETIRMPKVQEHQAPNFVGSNKYAFLEDSESTAD